MNSVSSLILAMFALLQSPVQCNNETEIETLTSKDMMSTASITVYQPINHETATNFSMWEKQIKAALIKKTPTIKKRARK